MPNATTLSIALARYPRLRVGLVGNTTSLSPVLRTALAMMDVTGAKIYGDNEGVLAALRQGEELDVLFLNWCGSHNDPVELASTLRGTRRHPDAFLAMAVLLSNVTREKVLTARDAGIDEFLAVPFTPAALTGRLKSIVHDRRGFVDTPTYFGPDRRRGAGQLPRVLQDRRVGSHRSCGWPAIHQPRRRKPALRCRAIRGNYLPLTHCGNRLVSEDTKNRLC